MALKSRTKRKIIWLTAIAAAIAAIALIAIPPMINLNSFRPDLEQAIIRQTGVDAKIRGNVRFSLMGRATIVAHDIDIPNGTIDSVTFAIPLHSIFNIKNAKIDGNISIRGGDIHIDKLEPVAYKNNISVSNINIDFMGKNYRIVSGRVSPDRFIGTVRTNDHKYDIDFNKDVFVIKNNNNNLEISGRLYPNGAARGFISIYTHNINAWFEFDEPKIKNPVQLNMNFEWDGEYGFKFTNIHANNYTGNITLYPSGARDINLRSSNSNADFSFLLSPTQVLHQTTLNLDLYGDMRFADRTFKHIACSVRGADQRLNITSITADDIKITGGYIDADGAHDITISMPIDGTDTTCEFSGTPDNWRCTRFSYGPYSGSMAVSNTGFDISVISTNPMPSADIIRKHLQKLGTNGRIDFQFSDAAGTMNISAPDNTATKYKFATNKTLRWLNPNIKFIPDFMYDAAGDFMWSDDTLYFTPYNKQWRITLTGDKFTIIGTNAKDWLPNIDLRSVNDLPYVVSGEYASNVISNLVIKIADHEFTGTYSGNKLTLNTDILNLDSFASQEFVDNYDELEFLTNAPITIPFSIPVQISLSANRMIYNGDEYRNFIYVLKPGTQTFSIADDNRGNMLATINKNKNEYDISLQLGRFDINGLLLSENMPLNIRDTTITAEIQMHTSGRIAHDIWNNIVGDMDMSFDDGYIVGIGTDKFYASVPNIGVLNAESALVNALESGNTAIKKLHIVGRYENGNFKTTAPIQLSMRHTDATGQMEIIDGNMTAQLSIIMRGTSPDPQPITLNISDNGRRSYLLPQIMQNFDPGFLREFIKTHNRF